MNVWLLCATLGSTFALDRLTKYWALHNLGAEPVTLWSWFNFDLSWNKGVSWSLLTPNSTIGFWILTGIIACLIACLALIIGKHVYEKTATVFEIMLFAGALSNLVDRIMYGAVLDFIQWHWQDWYWPTFNVADAAIVCGVIGIVFLNWWRN